MTIKFRNKVIKYLFTAVIAVQMSVYSFGQSGNTAENVPANELTRSNTYHISDAIQFVLENNPEILATNNFYQAAIEKVGAAGSLPDPKLEGTFFVDPIETRNGPIESQIMIGQKIPMWGKLKRQKNTAKLISSNAFLVLQSRKISASFSLRKHWAAHIKLTNSIKILKQYRTDLESFRTIALSEYATGVSKTQHSILKLQIEQSRIDSRINALESLLISTNGDLQVLFAGAFSEDIITDSWDINSPNESVEYWIDIARASNPQLQTAENNVLIATTQKELLIRNNYPDLTAGLTYSVVDQIDMPGLSTSGKDAFGVKIGLNIPLWFKKNNARVKTSKLNIDARSALHTEAWNQIEEGIKSVLMEYRESKDSYQIYHNKLLQESEQMLSSAASAYETGKISFLDLLDTKRMVVNVRLEHEEAILKNRIASAKLLRTVGLIGPQE